MMEKFEADDDVEAQGAGQRISLERYTAFAAGAAQQAMREVLAELAERSLRGELTLETPLPGGTKETAAKLSVPVAMTFTPRADEGDIALSIRARARKNAFPTFIGTLKATSAGPAATRLTLAGTYRVPLGALGALVNRAGLHQVAENGLRGFLDLVVRGTQSVVRRAADRAYLDARHIRY
jgi:hypothetical protein